MQTPKYKIGDQVIYNVADNGFTGPMVAIICSAICVNDEWVYGQRKDNKHATLVNSNIRESKVRTS